MPLLTVPAGAVRCQILLVIVLSRFGFVTLHRVAVISIAHIYMLVNHIYWLINPSFMLTLQLLYPMKAQREVCSLISHDVCL